MKVTKEFLAGLKMGNKQMIAAGVLEMLGADEEAIATAKAASRVTTAYVDRTFKPIMVEGEPEPTPEVEKPTADEPDTKDETSSEPKFPEVEKAIAKGKRKKALKLIKALEEDNKGSLLLKALKEEAKEL